MLRFRPDIKPPMWGPMPDVQFAVKVNAERMGIDPAAFVQYLPVWERGGVRLQDVFRNPDYVVGTDVASYRWSAYGLERTTGGHDPDVGLVKPAIVGGLFTIIQQIIPAQTWGRWYLSNRSEFGFAVSQQSSLLRLTSTIRASSGNVIHGSISHAVNQPIFATMAWDGTTFSSFCDGRLEGTTTPVSPLDLQSGQMSLLGNSVNTGSVGSVGAYLHVRQILTQAQIQRLYYEPYTLLMPVARPVYFDLGATAGTDNLTAYDLVSGSPVLGTPALGQVHALTATGITTSAPVIGSPALGQVHGLAATALTVSAPVLGTPTVGQVHSLVVSALVVGSPALGTPALTENAPDVDALTADNLVVGLPVLDTPFLGQIHVLGSDGLTVSSPVLGTPSLEIGKDHLTAQDFATEGPVLGTPALRQIHALVASFSTAAPEIGAPALTQAHALIPVNLAAGSPVLGTPMLFDLEYMLQTRAELKSLGTTNFTSPLYGTTHIELRCYGNYEVNEFGE